jgi:diacylglycerol O-acyltransferase
VTRADRLSALDAVFLPMETDTQSLHVGSVLILEGPAPDPAVFRQHVVSRLAAVPIHRRRVLRMPLDLGRPIWVDAASFDPADQVHHAALDAPGDQSQLRAMVARVMVPRLDPDRPLWEVWQIDGLAGGRWAVVAKAHHTMVDGQSGADLVQSLLTPVPQVALLPRTVGAARPEPSLVALAGDLVSWLVLLPFRAIRLLVRSVRAPREARRRVARVRFGLAQVIRPDLPPSVLTGPLGSRRTWGWAGADLAGVVQVTRRAHCTVNDVFLAALAGGLRRYLLDRGEPLDAMVLRAIVPVSRRLPGQPVRPGNLASAMFVELPVDVPDPAGRLAAVAARTAEQRSREVADATAAVVRMADHIPAALFARGARRYGRSGQGRVNVVASNVPGPPQVQYLAGRRLLELAPYVPTAQQIRVSAALVSYAGRVTIGITADAAALPDSDRLITAVGRELDDLVAEGCQPQPQPQGPPQPQGRPQPQGPPLDRGS